MGTRRAQSRITFFFATKILLIRVGKNSRTRFARSLTSPSFLAIFRTSELFAWPQLTHTHTRAQVPSFRRRWHGALRLSIIHAHSQRVPTKYPRIQRGKWKRRNLHASQIDAELMNESIPPRFARRHST